MNENNLPSTTLNFDNPKVIETIKRTVANGVDDIELAMFLELCKSSGLNPFKREVWCIKAGNRAQIMVGLNGYLKIANSHPQFDGMEISLDTSDKGELVSATCKVHRKDRKYPSTGIAIMQEYKKSTPIWSQMPSVMLSKVAKCIAIREAFPLETAGTYAEEEMPPEYSASQTKTVELRTGNGSPVAMPEKQQKKWVYDLDLVPEENRAAAKAFAVQRACTLDKNTGLYTSMKELKKLAAYETDEPKWLGEEEEPMEFGPGVES